MDQPAKDGRTCIRHNATQDLVSSLSIHSSRRGWIKRGMITQSRRRTIPRLGCSCFADLAPRAGSRTTSFVHFARGDVRNRRTSGCSAYTGPPSCPLAAPARRTQPSTHLQDYRAGRPEGKSRWMQASGALIGPRRAQELRVTWRGAWTGKRELPGDANAETRHGGCVGVAGLGEPVCRVLTPFSLPRSLFSFLMLLFSALLRRPTARANLGATQADHITIDLTCSALHAARPRLSGPHPRKPVS